MKNKTIVVVSPEAYHKGMLIGGIFVLVVAIVIAIMNKVSYPIYGPLGVLAGVVGAHLLRRRFS
ncbi:MAG: hypothetical protein WC631_00670 [Candidatus Paceibacterota bacterium]|jgi:hypothetical protein